MREKSYRAIAMPKPFVPGGRKVNRYRHTPPDECTGCLTVKGRGEKGVAVVGCDGEDGLVESGD